MLRAALVCLLLGSCLTPASTPLSAADPRPSIIVILCDDLGAGDLSCQGHPIIRTEHLDRLAAEGIRFTNFYSAAPVCSPSRTGLLTGRSPNRAGIYDWIPAVGDGPPRKAGSAKTAKGQEDRSGRPDARDQVHLRRGEVTLPALLKSAGYDTCLAGKWHCNSRFNSQDQPQPGDFGFDHWFATQNNAGPSHHNPANFVRNGKPAGALEGYSCGLVVDEVVQWLRQRNTSPETAPFFAFLAFHEPHEPIASPPDLVAHYLPSAWNEDQAQYFANVHNLDAAVGRLLQQLEQMNVRKNTLIVFSSDNGPETLRRYTAGKRSWGTTGVLRGMKLHTHDGGFHVAGIMNWPAGIRPGQTSDVPASALDLLPTLLQLAGAQPPHDRPLDGISLAGLLREGQTPQRSKPLLWAYYNAANEARVAMRHGPWKVLARLNNGLLPRYENLTPERLTQVQQAQLTDLEIYHLTSDPGETLNLTGRGLAEETELTALLHHEYRQLAADSPAWTPTATP
ncbi:MAG: sulfatase-like hydrolase/transferase [Planctomycetota bacterium]